MSFGNETHPNFVSNGETGEFDSTLEEVLYIINNAGHLDESINS